MAFIGLVCKTGEIDLSNKSKPVYKVKQETSVNPLCFEQEEEGDELKFELPVHEPGSGHLSSTEGLASFHLQLRQGSSLLNQRVNKQAHYILYKSLII